MWHVQVAVELKLAQSGDDELFSLRLLLHRLCAEPLRRLTILDQFEVTDRVVEVVEINALLGWLTPLTDPLELIDHPEQDLSLEG